jgi:hypothetical protein
MAESRMRLDCPYFRSRLELTNRIKEPRNSFQDAGLVPRVVAHVTTPGARLCAKHQPQQRGSLTAAGPPNTAALLVLPRCAHRSRAPISGLDIAESFLHT